MSNVVLRLFCEPLPHRIGLRKGQTHTREFMEKNCNLMVLDAVDPKSSFPEIAAFLARVGQDHEGGNVSPACIQTELQPIGSCGAF